MVLSTSSIITAQEYVYYFVLVLVWSVCFPSCNSGKNWAYEMTILYVHMIMWVHAHVCVYIFSFQPFNQQQQQQI